MDATPVTPPPAPAQAEGMLSADGKLRLYGYKNAPPQPLAPPRIVDLQPMVMTLAPGRYSWCSCGYSNKQPFCDDSHRLEENATNRRSYKFEALEEAQVSFCMCRHTGNPPYCDNTCKTLAAAAAATLPVAVAVPLPTVQQASASARAVVVQPRMSAMGALLLLIGRIAMAYIFVSFGIAQLTDLTNSQNAVASTFPSIPEHLQGIVALLFGVVLVLGGVMLVLGFAARFGALLLALLLVAMLVWAMPHNQMMFESVQFQITAALIGGMLAIMAFGAGPLSLDALYRKKG